MIILLYFYWMQHSLLTHSCKQCFIVWTVEKWWCLIFVFGNFMMIYWWMSLMDEIPSPAASSLFQRNSIDLFVFFHRKLKTRWNRVLDMLSSLQFIVLYRLMWQLGDRWSKVCGHVLLVWSCFPCSIWYKAWNQQSGGYHVESSRDSLTLTP